MERYKLIEVKYIDMYHFQMYEGKFQDLEQLINNEEIYIYANVSNFETEKYEDSEVRVYAHSYEKLYCAEDYVLGEFYSPMKAPILDYFKNAIMEKMRCMEM